MNLNFTYNIQQPLAVDLLNDVRGRFAAHVACKCMKVHKYNLTQYQQSMLIREITDGINFMYHIGMITSIEHNELLNVDIYAAMTGKKQVKLRPLDSASDIGLSADKQTYRVVRMWIRHKFQKEFHRLIHEAQSQVNAEDFMLLVETASTTAKCMRECQLISGAELLSAVNIVNNTIKGEVTTSKVITP